MEGTGCVSPPSAADVSNAHLALHLPPIPNGVETRQKAKTHSLRPARPGQPCRVTSQVAATPRPQLIAARKETEKSRLRQILARYECRGRDGSVAAVASVASGSEQRRQGRSVGSIKGRERGTGEQAKTGDREHMAGSEDRKDDGNGGGDAKAEDLVCGMKLVSAELRVIRQLSLEMKAMHADMREMKVVAADLRDLKAVAADMKVMMAEVWSMKESARDLAGVKHLLKEMRGVKDMVGEVKEVIGEAKEVVGEVKEVVGEVKEVVEEVKEVIGEVKEVVGQLHNLEDVTDVMQGIKELSEAQGTKAVEIQRVMKENWEEVAKKLDKVVEVAGGSTTTMMTGVSQLVSQELSCSICSELYIAPVTLACTHTFCKACLARWTSMSSVEARHSRCPTCREDIACERDALVLNNFIQSYVTSPYCSEELRQHWQSEAKAREGGRGESGWRGLRRNCARCGLDSALREFDGTMSFDSEDGAEGQLHWEEVLGEAMAGGYTNFRTLEPQLPHQLISSGSDTEEDFDDIPSDNNDQAEYVLDGQVSHGHNRVHWWSGDVHIIDRLRQSPLLSTASSSSPSSHHTLSPVSSISSWSSGHLENHRRVEETGHSGMSRQCGTGNAVADPQTRYKQWYISTFLAHPQQLGDSARWQRLSQEEWDGSDDESSLYSPFTSHATQCQAEARRSATTSSSSCRHTASPSPSQSFYTLPSTHEAKSSHYTSTHPDHHTSTPHYRTSTPHYHTSTPRYHTSTSDHHTSTPDLHTSTPDHYTSTPDHYTSTSDHHTSTPHYHTSTPHYHTSTSNHHTSTSDHHTSTPHYHTSTPDHHTSTSDHYTSTPDYHTSTPHYHTSTPNNPTSTSDHQTSTSDHQTSTSDHHTSTPDYHTSTSDHQTSTSDHQTFTSDHQASTSDYHTSTSDHPTSTPDGQSADCTLSSGIVTVKTEWEQDREVNGMEVDLESGLVNCHCD